MASKNGKSVCIHYWILPEPKGRQFVNGKCKKCGEVKKFSNLPDRIKYPSWREYADLHRELREGELVEE